MKTKINEFILRNKELIKDVLILSIIYLIAHGFILILTGTFWDDWLSYFQDTVSKDIEGWESGRPYYSMVIKMVWGLPHYGYRKLTFFVLYFNYLFIYFILRTIPFGEKACSLIITVLCMTIPHNDARVILANFPYSVGLLLFNFSFCIFVYKIINKKNYIFRIIAWVSFFLSFTLNSNLVMSSIVIIYIVISQKKINSILKYLDFIVAPIIFFVLNHLLFPTYGAYSNYNVVTIDGLINAIKLMPQVINEVFSILVRRCIQNERLVMYSIGLLIIWLVFTISKKQTSSFNPNKRVICLVCGIFVLAVGLFPYVVVRGVPSICLFGIEGRDSIQIGMGVALVLYALFSGEKSKSILVFLIIVGILQTNYSYLCYQKEWYRQLAFQNQIVKVEEVQQGGNFVVYQTPASTIGDSRFYSWTGNTVVATGKQNVLMMNGDAELSVLNGDMDDIARRFPMFNEYNQKNRELDGYVYFQSYISDEQTIMLKIFESFDQNRFEKYIEDLGTIDFVHP